MCQPRGLRCPSSAKKSLSTALTKKEEYAGDDPRLKRQLQVAVRKAMRDYHMTNEGQLALAQRIKEAEGDAKTVEKLSQELQKAKTEAKTRQAASAQYRKTNQAKTSINNFLEKHNLQETAHPIFKDDGTVIIVIDPKTAEITQLDLKEELKKSRLSFAHVEMLRESAQHWLNSTDPWEVSRGYHAELAGRSGTNPVNLKSRTKRYAAEQAHQQAMQASEARIAQTIANTRALEANLNNPTTNKDLQDYYDQPIITDNDSAPIKEWWEMTPEELAQFD